MPPEGLPLWPPTEKFSLIPDQVKPPYTLLPALYHSPQLWLIVDLFFFFSNILPSHWPVALHLLFTAAVGCHVQRRSSQRYLWSEPAWAPGVTVVGAGPLFLSVKWETRSAPSLPLAPTSSQKGHMQMARADTASKPALSPLSRGPRGA